jgi:hypothetical protein
VGVKRVGQARGRWPGRGGGKQLTQSPWMHLVPSGVGGSRNVWGNRHA